MNVLFAVWEMDPFFKVGGLGDIARSLPGALVKRGVDIRVVVPYYKALRLGRIKRSVAATIKVLYDGRQIPVVVIQTQNPTTGTTVYLLQNERYLAVPIHPDTYAFFSRAIVSLVQSNGLNWQPEIIHCNDLHTALVPLLVKEERLAAKTMLTIHNLAHQGPAAINVINKLSLRPDRCKVLEWEIKSKRINFLLEGIIHADVVTTVSPAYAKELLTEAEGVGLEDIVRGKEGRVFGILNGIDNDPLMDSIKYPFHRPDETKETKIADWYDGKRRNKAYLQKILGLRKNPDIPMLAFIGRIDPGQKGIELIHKMLRRLPIDTVQMALLGTGNAEWEERFLWLAKFYPLHVSCNFKFDEKLAHQIYAGADFLLVPSRYEPCGLVQMIAMYFGTLPIARRTGGLKDSIEDGQDGFLFDDYTSEALEAAVNRAIAIRKEQPEKLKQMIESAMRKDFSWKSSADQYISLYNKLVNNTL